MDTIQKIVNRMDPEEALAKLTAIVNSLFQQVNEEIRLNFVVGLTGQAAEDDKVSSLVQL